MTAPLEPRASPAGADGGPAAPRDSASWRNGLGLLALGLAVLALFSPFSGVEVQGRVGLLLVLAAVLEVVHGFRRSTAEGQRAAWVGGAITLVMGALLINAPNMATTALVFILAGWFGLDGLRYLVRAARQGWAGEPALASGLAAAGNLLVGAGLLLFWRDAGNWTVAVAGAFRMFGTAWNIVMAPVFAARDSGTTVVSDLGLPDSPELQGLARRLAEEEESRAAIDRGWIIGYLLTLLAIHLGRMGFDRTILGLVAPGVAVLGDLFLAIAIAFGIVIPASVLLRRVTRRAERWGWGWGLRVEAPERGWGRRLVLAALSTRLRHTIRLRQARYSFRTAFSRAMQIGLPIAAIIAATVPVWGMSWYFDTENWAAGMWNSWAEERTDTWREAMVRSLAEQEAAAGPDRAFAVSPPGLVPGADFSFLVIGDTGEGDASQHSLRDSYLAVVRRDDVRFVVISSDVVYPTGAMRDYEAKFWLPFKGTTKPVYAIPGNHDWYDALEGFVATFLEPAAARVAMRARVEVDRRITSTTDRRIEELIAQATRLRGEYRVPTQLQKAPFFQVQTDTFALFAIDTGIVRRVDATQRAWLEGALKAAKGKTKMAVLGHPLYAGGVYTARNSPDFQALHELLIAHDVAIVMAGDTHDLEYYAENREGRAEPVHHFVNGGGGAYLSFGTALAWPADPATDDWAFYPRKADVVAKIQATTPWWKSPAWWWTREMGAWPFSPEWLSAAFDSNVAPFFQSFIEVRVEPSKRRVRLLPHGVHGPLRWRDLETSPHVRPAGATADTPVEWVVPMGPAPR